MKAFIVRVNFGALTDYYKIVKMRDEKSKNKENKNTAKISDKDNEKIISLIRSKLSPLHTKLNHFPKINSNNKKSFHQTLRQRRKRISHDIILSDQIFCYEHMFSFPKVQLIERAKNYVKQRKKNLQISDPQMKNDLNSYLRLFNQDQDKEHDMMEEFLKMKKEGQKLLNQQPQSYPNGQAENLNSNQMTEEQQMEMNAKIRKRINHKKIIALVRNK